jgi:hypothetical protein
LEEQFNQPNPVMAVFHNRRAALLYELQSAQYFQGTKAGVSQYARNCIVVFRILFLLSDKRPDSDHRFIYADIKLRCRYHGKNEFLIALYKNSTG